MNIFEFAYNVEQKFFKQPLKDFGYQSFTTFYSDLTLAECCSGINGVKETIKNVINSWLDDYEYFTEFVMAINHKSHEVYYRQENNLPMPNGKVEDYLEFYSNEFYKLQDLFYAHYKGNNTALQYYFETTD